MRIAVLLFVLSACAKNATPAAVTVPQAAAASQELVPYPYTAEQIREAHPDGREIVFRHRDDASAQWQRIVFSAATDATVTVVGATWDEGSAETPGEGASVRWDELQQHASFPAANTSVEPGHSVTVPAGTFESVRYSVLEDGTMTHYFFAPELPGPPVLLVVEGGAVMEMVDSGR